MEVFLDHNCSDWRNGYQTYILPTCYTIRMGPEYPEYLPSGYCLQKKLPSTTIGCFAENYVLSIFAHYFYFNSQPAFIFHNCKFREEQNEGEMDMVIVHRKLGIILIEIKDVSTFNKQSIENKHYKAKKQIDRGECYIIKNYNSIEGLETKIATEESNFIIKKIIAMPSQYSSNVPSRNNYINLCRDHLINYESFEMWWNRNVTNNVDQSSIHEQQITEVYHNMVSKLMTHLIDCNELNNYEALEVLTQQTFLENSKIRKIDNGKKHKFGKATVDELGPRPSVLKDKWKCITLEQCNVWMKEKQVIYGSYGSGKTVLIQCKAADLARSRQKVLVIVPFHLIVVYKKFFEEHVIEINIKKYILLISRSQFYNKFDKYEEEAYKRNVFVDELMCPSCMCEDNIAADHSFMKFLYCLFLKRNQKTLWVVPHLYFLVEHTLCSNDSNSIHSLNLAANFKNIFRNVLSTNLTFTMRTTKQIDDYKNILEFKSLHNFKFTDDHFQDRYFQLIINSTLGHSLSGQNIKFINYSVTQCEEYGIEKGTVSEANMSPFYIFCAYAINNEFKKLKSKYRSKEIAITTNFHYKSIILLNSVQHHLLNIPNSIWTEANFYKFDELPSREWPVVIHINDHFAPREERSTLEFQGSLFLRNQHNLIISRCIHYYIIICHSDDPPTLTNKTFSGFREFYRKKDYVNKTFCEALTDYKATEYHATATVTPFISKSTTKPTYAPSKDLSMPDMNVQNTVTDNSGLSLNTDLNTRLLQTVLDAPISQPPFIDTSVKAHTVKTEKAKTPLLNDNDDDIIDSMPNDDYLLNNSIAKIFPETASETNEDPTVSNMKAYGTNELYTSREVPVIKPE